MKSENVDLIEFNFIKKIKIKIDRTFVRFSLAFFGITIMIVFVKQNNKR